MRALDESDDIGFTGRHTNGHDAAVTLSTTNAFISEANRTTLRNLLSVSSQSDGSS